MNETEKQIIKSMFEAKCLKMGLSQERGATDAGTKGTTVSQVFNGKYPANDDAVYKLLAVWVGFKGLGWNVAETVNFKLIHRLLDDSKNNANVYLLEGGAGWGKSFAIKKFSESTENAFMLGCEVTWNRKQFLVELMTKMGKQCGGLTESELLAVITKHLLATNEPIIIMDEADKLNDDVLYFFITLYNRLEDHCGLVMSATEHLTIRLKRGVTANRKGYAEIWSRIGRKPITCEKTREKDVKAVCEANGVTDADTIKLIFMECEGDLRRVKRGIHKAKLKGGE